MKKYFVILIIIFSFFAIFYVYKELNSLHVIAKFKELRPFENNIPVYYRGIVIGKTTSKEHSKDGSHTLIKMILYKKNLLFPKNTKVFLKKEKKNNTERDFLEFIYPKNPSNIMISNYSILDGFVSNDMDTFLGGQNPESIEALKENILTTTKNLAIATEKLSELLDNINSVVTLGKGNVINTTKNIENMTEKIDNSLNQNSLNNTISSMEAASQNISSIIESTNDNLMPTINSTTSNVNGISENINAITCGVRKTLRKKCGMIRLIFGQVIDECN